MNATLVSKMTFWALYIERFWIIYFELIYWTVYWSCVFIVFYILSCILIIFCTECQMVGHKAQLIQLPIKGDSPEWKNIINQSSDFGCDEDTWYYIIYIYILYYSRCFSQVFRSVTWWLTAGSPSDFPLQFSLGLWAICSSFTFFTFFTKIQ